MLREGATQLDEGKKGLTLVETYLCNASQNFISVVIKLKKYLIG